MIIYCFIHSIVWEINMYYLDQLTSDYSSLLDGCYDSLDRIVLNGYYCRAQSNGGFRLFWRELYGNEEKLNNAELMRCAGRYSRRLSRWCSKNNIPLLDACSGERKTDWYKDHLPSDPDFRGVFCIITNRAPAPLRKVTTYKSGAIDIHTKKPYPYAKHYFFHIMDPEWGHVIIRICPHPPFNVQIILNGHNYLEKILQEQNIIFTKKENCFTEISHADGLQDSADTMKADGFGGRVRKLCQRWVYSCCLNFALTDKQQQEVQFRYSFSTYQLEVSRNLIFKRGNVMERAFNDIIDRNRSRLDMNIIKTIFGRKYRPRRHRKGNNKPPAVEVTVETPEYNLTVFKIRFGAITIKMYTKGNNVLRAEVTIHNSRKMRSRRSLPYFHEIPQKLSAFLDNFLNNLEYTDTPFIEDDILARWSERGYFNNKPIAGLKFNCQRQDAVMNAVLQLNGLCPDGFQSGQVAAKVREITGWPDAEYSTRKAAYDLKKLRAKELVQKIGNSRRYKASENGIKTIAGFFIIRDETLRPVLSSLQNRDKIRKKKIFKNEQEECYAGIKTNLMTLFEIKNFKAVS